MVQSQNAPVTVSHERSAKGEVTFYADNTSYSPFTVALTFTRLSGTSSFQEGETYKSTAKHGRTRLIVLRPVSENEGIGFAYRFNTAKGDFRTEDRYELCVSPKEHSEKLQIVTDKHKKSRIIIQK